jgi:ATP/maltotriose-dependent transcriptional regulator MalT
VYPQGLAPAIERTALNHVSPVVSPIVGRDAIMSDLQRSLRQIAAGGSGCVIVEGMAGMGKSRILHTTTAEAATMDIAVASGSASKLDRAAPMTTLRHLLQATDPPGLELPSIARLDRNPLWLVDQVREVVEDYLRHRPLLIVLDDAHWADELTAFALRILVPALFASPVLWLLSRRPAPVGTYPQDAIDWLIAQGAQRHQLDPLPDEVVADLCRNVLGAVPDPSVLAIARRGEGNPFLLEQLLTTLLDTGQVMVRDGTATAAGGVLSSGFLDAVDQRLQDLSEHTRRLLDAGAVLGRPFTIHEVAGLVGQSAIELLPAIREAAYAAILVDNGTELSFRHDLIREALYNRLPGPVRLALHREAAAVVREEGRTPIEVAEHLVLSGRPNSAQAVAVLRQAVQQVAPSAPNTAADLILRMLDLIDGHDAGRPRLVAEGVRLLALTGRVPEAMRLGESALHAGLDANDEVALLLGLSEALLATGRSTAVLRYTSQAIARASDANPARAELLSVRALGLLERADGEADLTAADASGAEAAALGTAAGEHAAAVCGINARGVAAMLRGELTSAVEFAREATRIADRIGGEARRRHPRLWLAAVLTAVDRFDEAEAVLAADQRDAELLGTAWTQPRWCHHRTILLAEGGRPDDAAAEAEAGVRMAEQLSAIALSVPLLSRLGQLAIQRDDLIAARDYLDRAHKLVEQDGTRLPEHVAWATALLRDAAGEPATAALDALAGAVDTTVHRITLFTREPGAAAQLTRLALRAGADEVAREAATVTRQLADRNPGVPSLAGAAAHAQALLDGDLDALREAVRAFQDSPRPLAGAAALADLAQFEATAGRRHEAVGYWQEALQRYLACGAKLAAARAQQGLRTLGVRRSWRRNPLPRSTGWDSLTESELRVVRLVAKGLTNREVASNLFLSPHTIDSHLRHSFSKLGVANRVELTRYVLDHDREQDQLTT